MCTPGDVRRSLKVLPDTLTEVYGEIYKHIVAQKGSAPRLALNAFRWIQCSYEPIRTQTLLDAITVEIGQSGEFSREDTIKVNDLLRACHNLIILDEGLNVFRIAHLSVDEYLETQLPRVDSHGTIAKVCLSLLCTSSHWGDYDAFLQTYKGDYHNRHLLLYSAVFWPWHLGRCEDANTCPILTRIWDTFASETVHQRWLDYHRRCVAIHNHIEDIFWRRSYALQKGSDDLLSTVCVFGLGRRFTSVFTSQSVRKPRLDQLFLQSCQFGDLDVARLLLSWGADVAAASKDGQTSLYLASENGNEAVARLLVDRRADVTAADKDGQTPLHIALERRHEAVARLLADRGADVTAADKYGLTPLHIASQKGDEAVAWLLLDRGADATAADKFGRTPLHIVLERGHEAVARLLVDRGVDVTAVNKYGLTPLHIVSQKGDEAVAALLLDRGADATAAEKFGRTPLHIALERGHEAIVRLLVDQGTDVTAADKSGQTPLHIASQKGDEAVTRLLLDRGADITAVDKNWRTALHIASENGHETVARLLVDRGADVTAADKVGRTPLDLATMNGHQIVVRPSRKCLASRK